MRSGFVLSMKGVKGRRRSVRRCGRELSVARRGWATIMRWKGPAACVECSEMRMLGRDAGASEERTERGVPERWT